jgi:hypothetical protein
MELFSPYYRKRSGGEVFLSDLWAQLEMQVFDFAELTKRKRTIEAALKPMERLGYTTTPQYVALNIIQAILTNDSAPCFYAIDGAGMAYAATVLYRQGAGHSDPSIPPSYEWNQALRFQANVNKLFHTLLGSPVATVLRASIDQQSLIPIFEPLSPELYAAKTTTPPAAESDYWSSRSRSHSGE